MDIAHYFNKENNDLVTPTPYIGRPVVKGDGLLSLPFFIPVVSCRWGLGFPVVLGDFVSAILKLITELFINICGIIRQPLEKDRNTDLNTYLNRPIDN